MRMSNMTVVIPCRAGSTRVKNKNFKKFSNSSLLEIKITQAKSLGLKVVVNSDSDVAREAAKKHKIGFVRRPRYFASSECTNSQYYEYLANSVDTPDIMILQPTAPLIKVATIQRCLDDFYKRYDSLDSLVTCEFVKKFAWYHGKPINYDIANMPNSQDLQPIIMPTYNVMICKVNSLLDSKNVITERCHFFEVSDVESVEIDTPLEFEVAEILYERNQ